MTYAAVAVAFVPIALHDLSKTRQGHAAQQSTGQRTEAQQAAGAERDASRDAGRAPGSPPNLFLGTLMLLGFGLISPFLLLTASVATGLLNLFILFLGMRAAWQLTSGANVLVEGPYSA